VRVGEHIAKSTCHVCHSAVGQNPSLAQLYAGEIPPLSALPVRTTQAQFVRKVTQGAPILMGEPPQLLRGRMPVFYYLSEEEAADVYLYLTTFPPSPNDAAESAKSAAVVASAIESDPPRPDPSAPVASTRLRPVPVADVPRPNAVRSQAMLADEQLTILAVLLGLLASMVLGLGFWFSVLELRRLSGDRRGGGHPAGSPVSRTSQLDPELAA
jgi:mono/diheme cytochrome c family protein